MAKKKLTKAQRGRLLMNSDWSEAELNDPLVLQLRSRREEEEKRQQNPNFDNVRSGFRTTEVDEPEPEKRPFDYLTDAAVGGLQRSVAGLAQISADPNAMPGWQGDAVRAIDTWANDVAPESVRDLRDRSRGAVQQFADEQFRAGSEKQRVVDEYVKNVDAPTWAKKLFQAEADVAGSPSSLASIPGGPFASAAAIDTYAQEYNSAIKAGLDPETARRRAIAMAGIEGGISILPAGKAGKTVLKGLGLEFGSDLAKHEGRVLAEKIGKTILGEGLEEGVTQAGQIGVDEILAGQTKDEKTRKFAQDNTVNAWDQIKRATLAGMLGGGALGGPMESLHVAAEAGKRAAELNEMASDAIGKRDSKRNETKINLPSVDEQRKTLNLPTAEEIRSRLAHGSVNTNELIKQRSIATTNPENVGDTVDALLAGLNQNRDTEDTSIPSQSNGLERAYGALLERSNHGDVKILHKLLKNGNVQIVEDASEIPSDAVEAGTAGHYDGKTTYIVANKLNPENTVGDMLSIAAHEGKHAADVSGNEKLKASFRGLVGQDVNTSLVKRIEALAAKDPNLGDYVAEVKEGAESPEEYTLELPAYFINYAMDNRNASTLVKRLAGDTVSAVRVAAKKRLGIDEVNLNDVAYLSRQLLAKTAENGEQLTGNVSAAMNRDGANMIIGPNAKGFVDIPVDRRYTSVDQNQKSVISDANSAVNMQGLVAKLGVNRSVELGDLLTHDELFARYPDLRKLKVKIASNQEAKDFDAAYYENRDEIEVAPQELAYVVSRSHEPSVVDNFKGLLLHEVQHAVQAREGSARGGSPLQFISKEDKAKIDELDQQEGTLRTMVNNIDGSLDEVLPESGKRLVAASREAFRNEDLKLVEHAQDILQAIKSAGTSGKLRLMGLAIEKPLRRVQELQTEVKEIKDEAFKQYHRLLGESEARFTQDKRDVEQEWLPANPEPEDIDILPERAIINKFPARAAGGLNQIREPLRENYRTDLSKYTDTLYRETSIRKALELIPYSGRYTEIGDLYFAETPELALGQGDNKGVLLELDSKGIEGVVNMNKPMADVMFQNGNAEFLSRSVKQTQMQKAVKSVTIKNDATADKVDKIVFNRALKQMEENGWTKTANEDGSVTYSRPTKTGANFKRIKQARKTNDNLDATLRVAERLLAPGGFLDGQLKEIVRHASDLPASEMVKATMLGNNMIAAIDARIAEATKGMKGDAVRRTRQKFRLEVTKELERIDKLESRAERNAALDAMDRNPKFKGIGSAVRALRDFKVQLTQDIIALRKRDPKPFSDKELAIYKKMVENAERYTTRAYLATYNSKIGYEFGKNMMKRFKMDPKSVEGQIVQRALDFLASKELIIPDLLTLQEMPLRQLRRIHENWIGTTKGYEDKTEREDIIAALKAMPAKTKAEIDAKALEIVKDLLNLNRNKSTSGRFYSIGAKQNRTILEARSDIPPELRALMGEITDPFLREAISLQRMINLSAKTKLLTEVFEAGATKGWWSDTKTDEHEHQLNDISYGPLQGKWINRDLVDALTGTILSLESTDKMIADAIHNPTAFAQFLAGAGVKGLTTISRVQKTYRVIYSLAQMGFNFGGAFLNVALNGVVNPKTAARGLHNAALVLMSEINSKVINNKNLPTIQEIVRAGVIDSATVGELKSQAYQKITEEITKLNPEVEGYHNKVFAIVWKALTAQGSISNAVRQVYAFMDVWTKVATYHDRKNFLTAFNKAENAGWTDEQIQRRAGYEASGTNISYERAIPLAKILEKNVPFAMFLTYFSEVPRTVFTSYAQAAADAKMAMNAKTAKGKALATAKATTRFIGTSAVTAGLIAGTLAAIGSDDDDEQKRRRLDPDWMQNKWMLPLGKNKDGNEVFFEVNRFDPNGPMNEAIISVIQAPEDKKAAAVLEAVKGLFVPAKGAIAAYRTIHDLVIASVASVTGSEETRAADMSAEQTAFDKNWPAQAAKFKQAMSYGDLGENLLAAFERVLVPAQIQPLYDKRGFVTDTSAAKLDLKNVPQALGYRAYVRNPDEAFGFRMRDYTSAMENINKAKGRLLRSAPLMNEQDLVEKLTDLKDREREAFTSLRDVYEGYLAADRKPADALEIVKDRKLFGKLQYNRFSSAVLDRRTLASWAKNQIKEGRDRQEVMNTLQLLQRAYVEADQEN